MDDDEVTWAPLFTLTGTEIAAMWRLFEERVPEGADADLCAAVAAKALFQVVSVRRAIEAGLIHEARGETLRFEVATLGGVLVTVGKKGS